MLLRGKAGAVVSMANRHAMTSSRRKGFTEKTLHLVRHGTTEMNEYLVGKAWDGVDFVDPMLYDTRLSRSGIEQARGLQESVMHLFPEPEVIVASPLTRAIHTADLAFEKVQAPRIVSKLVSERIYHAADIGRSPWELREESPHWEFVDLHEEHWWHYEEEHGPHVPFLEPEHIFNSRMKQLLQWIGTRPESSMVLVSHWGVLAHLTGKEFDNCEMMTVSLSTLYKKHSLL